MANPDYTARNDTRAVTQNACRLCTPLGACLAFRGIRRGMPYLHGSQGCSTYIRRYMISHFREPIDIASSNFSETTAVFGGRDNLHRGLDNIIAQYQPDLVGIATTCLSETIGEDLSMLLHEYLRERAGSAMPALVHVSTPSYRGSHVDGYHDAVRAIVATLAERRAAREFVNILPGMVSPADLRYLKQVMLDYRLSSVMLPDYARTLDDGGWDNYHRLPRGGTPVARVRTMGDARASLALGRMCAHRPHAAELLDTRYGVPAIVTGLPVGVNESDAFFAQLGALGRARMPRSYEEARGRLLDAYVDAHKYVFGARVAVYGEDDLVIGLAAMLGECGFKPVLCATGGRHDGFEACLRAAAPDLPDECQVAQNADFAEIDTRVRALKPDMLVGNSKGYTTARALGIPLVRVGFPVHDRIGAARIRLLGYEGTHQLFDRLVNAALARRQDKSTVGFTYL
jgi:nitrogenase molybdenum-iron protein NifN